MNLSCFRREFRSISNWVPFFLSPALLALIYAGFKWLEWNSETEIPSIIATAINARYSAENLGVTLLLIFVLMLTSIGFVKIYNKRLPRNEKSAILGWFILSQRVTSSLFYFSSGTYLSLWIAPDILPIFSTFPYAGILAFGCFLFAFSIAYYSRMLKIAIITN